MASLVRSAIVRVDPSVQNWSMVVSEPQTLRLAGDCGIRTVRALCAEMATALRNADRLHVDCANADRIDLSFVQLIVSAQKTAHQQAKQIRVTNLSDAARSAFARAGTSLPDTNEFVS